MYFGVDYLCKIYPIFAEERIAFLVVEFVVVIFELDSKAMFVPVAVTPVVSKQLCKNPTSRYHLSSGCGFKPCGFI